MLSQDTAAFIEQLEVQRDDTRAEKERRRRTRAELDVLRAEWERRLASDALKAMELELASLHDRAEPAAGRRLLHARKRRTLESGIASLQSRVRAMEAAALAARERLRTLERTSARVRPRPGAKVFRFHSATHHIECSEQRFTRLAKAQSDLPVLVGESDGRRWWWFRDRFWWDEEGLRPNDVKRVVLGTDLRTRQQAEAMREARAALFHEAPTRSVAAEPASQVVRFAVWCRDRGRCVDCGTPDDVTFDVILPESPGGAHLTANVELRCTSCRERRTHNQERTRVGRALVDVQSQVL